VICIFLFDTLLLDDGVDTGIGKNGKLDIYKAIIIVLSNEVS
jgi:hypothetical protein